MEIVKQRPPNFSEIAKVFKGAWAPGVIFAYNNKIYNPSGFDLSPALIAHESVHCERQGMTEEECLVWWNHYLTSKDFRYHEELLAHRAEYNRMLEDANNFKKRQLALKIVSKKLAAPLYGGMCTRKEAERELIFGNSIR